MSQPKLLRAFFTVGFITLAFPSSLLAQGSPDIIWKRQVNVDRVNSVIFSSSGDTLVSGGSDRLINVWRVSDGTLLQTLNTNAAFVHASAIESLSLNRDGNLLASCSYKLIQLWKLPSGAMQKLLGHTDWVVGVAFSPDGTLLASASFDTTVRIWRASDGALLRTIPGVAQQRCVAFSPDGSLLAIGGGDKSIRLFRTSDWTLVQTLSGHTADVFVVAFSPDGTTVASGGYDNTAKIWNVADGSLKFTFSGNGGTVYGLAYTPDGTKLAYTDGEGNTIKVYRTADGALLRTFTVEVDAVQTVAFSAAGLIGYGRIDETVVLSRIDTAAAARISSPAPGTTFNSPATISIVASPSKAASSIASMEFFQNGIKIGQDLTSPFSFNWTGVAAGSYALTATETDNNGVSTTSPAVTVTVIGPTNQLPSISITGPSAGSVFGAPAHVTITASAAAPSGIANVEFFQDGISLGQDTRAPFNILWSSVPAGNYSLTAIVTDKNGAIATASPINITVGNGASETVKPTVVITTPPAGARLGTPDTILKGTASDDTAVAVVLYSLNGTSFRSAEGTTSWEASIALLPGENIVQVKSVDSSGNESEVLSRTITYIAS
ncbi:MAG: Ig-like domain-containing protein, partial [Verrucomicrobiota bacterium]